MTAHREHIRIRYFAAAHAAATVDDEVRFIARRLEAESIALVFSAREVEVAELAGLPRRHLTPATSALGMTGPQRCSDPSNRRLIPMSPPDRASTSAKPSVRQRAKRSGSVIAAGSKLTAMQHISPCETRMQHGGGRSSRRTTRRCSTTREKLVAVIGQRVRRVNSDTALASVAGYTVGTDVSVRDCWQDTSRWR
jgi:hypothetical protein